MSFTVIVPFDQDGTAVDDCARIRNSWRGGMAVWKAMEQRYLPPYIPDYVEEKTPEEYERAWGRPPTRLACYDEKAWQELWDTVDDKEIPFDDRIVMATTLDNVIVPRSDIPRVIEAFRKFGGETSLPEQAETLEGFLDDEGVSAVAWNQTSVNANRWLAYTVEDPDLRPDGYDEGEGVAYNYRIYDDHWFLFDEISE